ncbi:MAG: DUF4178 domain-containing protein [Acidobacteria bacterium]|nr:DUF4178 domain-containing protein [Acidobacteriota bacterium]
MTQPVANCPNCGAPVRFRFSSAVQSVCEYCRSILVRRDVNLERVGEVADLPPDPSPIQIATEGIYRNRPFVVAGRILYEYDQGGWNEWHIVFSDGANGWLSDAMAEYAVSFAVVPPPEVLPAAEQIHRGRRFRWYNVDYHTTVLTHARYRGVEGELPFEYWNKDKVVFADLRTEDARFGTIDYSEWPPLLFLGEAVEFDSLRFKNLRRVEGWDA